MSRPTVHDVLRKRLKLHPYNLQILQQIAQEDKVSRREFAMILLDRVDQDNAVSIIMFSDDATFTFPAS